MLPGNSHRHKKGNAWGIKETLTCTTKTSIRSLATICSQAAYSFDQSQWIPTWSQVMCEDEYKWQQIAAWIRTPCCSLYEEFRSNKGHGQVNFTIRSLLYGPPLNTHTLNYSHSNFVVYTLFVTCHAFHCGPFRGSIGTWKILLTFIFRSLYLTYNTIFQHFNFINVTCNPHNLCNFSWIRDYCYIWSYSRGVLLNIQVFWSVPLCYFVSSRHFEGSQCLRYFGS
jgi:hypothetical protein